MGKSNSFLSDIREAPKVSGVYLIKDDAGKVLYVGKAKNLHRRVSVYAREGADGRLRLKKMLHLASNIEYRITSSETEAILLESNLVKKLQPRLNVLLKDDKSFLYIQIDSRHDWPRVFLSRKPQEKASNIYGPYPSASAARYAKYMLQKIYGLRDCSDSTFRNRKRPCLKHSTGFCSAPCVNNIKQEEYRSLVAKSKSLLRGRVEVLIKEQELIMHKYSREMNYESALRCRQRIEALNMLSNSQNVTMSQEVDFDAIAIDERGAYAVLQFRQGEWLHTVSGFIPFFLDIPNGFSQLLTALYVQGLDVPPRVFVYSEPSDISALESAVRNLGHSKFAVHVPRYGEKKKVVQLALRNAESLPGQQREIDWPPISVALRDFFDVAGVRVVDCIDVSHFQGKERVASCVRFFDGAPDKSYYRHFVVEDDVGGDDASAIASVVKRLLAREYRKGLPDLIVVDGGPQQLNAAKKSFSSLDDRVPCLGIAKARSSECNNKARERIYFNSKKDPIILSPDTALCHFFERLRDEAHRFAISHHRERRDKIDFALDDIVGIGPVKRKQLLDFCAGDLRKFAQVSVKEIAEIKGIDVALAARIKKYFS